MGKVKKLTLSIGAKDTEAKKVALLNLAKEVHAIGRNGEPSISELIAWLADCAAVDLYATVDAWDTLPRRKGDNPPG